jgi:hypothetical protein
MRRSVTFAAAIGTLIVAVVVALIWRSEMRSQSEALQLVPGAAKPMARTSTDVPPESLPRARPLETPAPRGLTAGEKAACIEKIKRDYDEIRAKASADYTAAGAAFPGGLNAFLHQLALLEREKRADLAAVLSPQELEELEMHETAAGQNVERLLGPTHATVEQRRTVFRLQREFEDKFALTFDLTPRALLEREAARQQMQEQIRAVLGDDLFGSWLFGEGEDYALFVAFAVRHNLPPTAPLELRQVKNEYALRRLELNAVKNMTEDQRRIARAELARQTEARVMSIIGQSALQAGRKGILSWLPKK